MDNFFCGFTPHLALGWASPWKTLLGDQWTGEERVESVYPITGCPCQAPVLTVATFLHG